MKSRRFPKAVVAAIDEGNILGIRAGHAASPRDRNLGGRGGGSRIRALVEPQAAELVADVRGGPARNHRGRWAHASGARGANAQPAAQGRRSIEPTSRNTTRPGRSSSRATSAARDRGDHDRARAALSPTLALARARPRGQADLLDAGGAAGLKDTRAGSAPSSARRAARSAASSSRAASSSEATASPRGMLIAGSCRSHSMSEGETVASSRRCAAASA